MPRGRLWILFLFAPLFASCDKQGAYGDPNNIILATAPGLWTELEDTLYAVLEARIRTVRDEKMFTVTYQDPAGEYWGNLRRFKQMLLAGTATDPWMAEALMKLSPVPTAPALVQVRDVWARGQLATILLLPAEGAADALVTLLPELHSLYRAQYRDWAVNRMFISGKNEDLAENLRASDGFTLMLPNVYRSGTAESLRVFRNDQPDPSELIREITVAWRPADLALLDQAALLQWRREVTGTVQEFQQIENVMTSEAGPTELRGHPGFQIQANWQNPPEANWPAGGPFILRAVHCPEQNRTYLIDAWLYAPGKDKFEYMIQLETILDSFECGV